jgi:stage V sporulation protein G
LLSVTPGSAGKLFALASVEVDIDRAQITIHGIRAVRVDTTGTRIELPKFRNAPRVPRSVITLPDEIRGPVGDAVLDALIERASQGAALRCRYPPKDDRARTRV